MTTDKKMSGMVIALISTVVLFAGFAISAAAVAFFSYKNAVDYGGRTEATLKAGLDQSRMRLGNHENKILEVMQVDAANRDATSEAIKAAVEGRYGPNGSQAMFQSLQEAGIPISHDIRNKAAAMIEAGRNAFTTSQETNRDRAAAYEARLNSFWEGFWLRAAGFPKIDLNDFKGISTGRADSVFEAGVEATPLQIYAPKK